MFGYRGVVLFPWLARVYDRDVEKPGATLRFALFSINLDVINIVHLHVQYLLIIFNSENEEMKELKGQVKVYYQVLMDNRDSPYTVRILHELKCLTVSWG